MQKGWPQRFLPIIQTLFRKNKTMLQIKNLQLRRGEKVLLDKANLTLNPGWKAGLIGPNGAGKSSFFALVMKQLQPDAGDASLPANWRLSHVAQETPALPQAAIEYVIDGDKLLRAAEQRMDAAMASNDGDAIGEALADIDTLDGYTAPARAAKLLCGLGFDVAQHQTPVAEFSGGWRMRLNLAQALMCPADILLLDEPTNHLDLETVLWLEDWLQRFDGMLLLISHDRDFLDAVTDHTVEVAAQQLTLYTGNYSAFEQQRAAKALLQQGAFIKQQRQISHLESFITRFKAKASKAKQAQSRVKALERLELIAPAHTSSPFDFEFDCPSNVPNPLLKLDHATMGYSAQSAILKDITLSIESGARIGLLGVNGAGKSTLIKTLADEIQLLQGEKVSAQQLNIAYFAQHQLDFLHEDDTPLSHMQRMAKHEREQVLRSFLGGFNFTANTVNQLIGTMSGGEKARLVLACLVWTKPNLLLLDEPTNHLDLEMRHALTMALQSFTGGLIVVSHDRALLAATTDDFWLVHDGKVAPFDGDLDDYRQFRVQQMASASAENKILNSQNKQLLRQEAADKRAQIAAEKKPLQKALADIEKKIAPLSAKKTELDGYLATESAYLPENKATLAESVKKQALYAAELADFEGQWLLIQEELEALDAASLALED